MGIQLPARVLDASFGDRGALATVNYFSKRTDWARGGGQRADEVDLQLQRRKSRSRR